MKLDRDTIGKTVTLYTGQGQPYATGVVYAYCEAPQLAIETPDGTRIWWRADLTKAQETE